ncbi:glycosyltransferase [Rickettsia typhi]|uniref:Glycosyltransferase n=2 Tax=Rickettsia typhi TaxID=785 RepID=Q68WT2_RICTY|nr:glycosyltransferase [Rickettsia typhi]AAU03910.1 glycosyltransferase [Rickettsia typhi str. Wilmington]AFE54291.1 glycosyltransferase [Rickettsia typhi str. TH1527]AFE55131.1 glycosyltransferase [Rickettsia typhi str. B9991CWPP]
MHTNYSISIVLTVYNREKLLPFAIESCLNQSFKDFELIIIDDCSKDNSAMIAKKYAEQDSRIKIIINEHNKRLSASLNIAFKKANGKYFTWTSDDNLFHEDALAKMVKILDNSPEIGLVYTDYTLIDEQGNIGARLYQESPKFLPIRDCVGACFLYRADLAKQVGGYNENMALVDDYEYWLRLGLITKFAHIPESLYFYRAHDQSLTIQRKVEAKIAKRTLKKLFQDKYIIPDEIKPINDLYNWFIEDRNLISCFRLLKIIIYNPIITISYIIKNLRRIR